VRNSCDAFGKKCLVSADQLLDLTCGSVETAREASHFILALHRDTCRKIACTERLDAAL